MKLWIIAAISLIIMIVAYMTIGLWNTVLTASAGALAYYAYNCYAGDPTTGKEFAF
jgi:uncharacterized membrane protein